MSHISSWYLLSPSARIVLSYRGYFVAVNFSQMRPLIFFTECFRRSPKIPLGMMSRTKVVELTVAFSKDCIVQKYFARVGIGTRRILKKIFFLF